ERLDRDLAEPHAVAELAEHLRRGRVVAGARLVGEAGEGDRAERVDVMPGKGATAAQAPVAEACTEVAGNVMAVDVGRPGLRDHLDGRAAVAAADAEAPQVGDAAVDAGEDTPIAALHLRSVAVAVPAPPGAVALRPSRHAETGRRRRRHRL